MSLALETLLMHQSRLLESACPGKAYLVKSQNFIVVGSMCKLDDDMCPTQLMWNGDNQQTDCERNISMHVLLSKSPLLHHSVQYLEQKFVYNWGLTVIMVSADSKRVWLL